MNAEPIVDVAIVGAGLAGLTAARALVRLGRSVVVLEARDRIGGRVWSTQLAGGLTLDRGAQYIGARQPRMLALAREAGSPLDPAARPGCDLVLGVDGASFRRSGSDTPPLPWWALLDAASLRWRLARRVRSEVNAAALDDMPASALIRSLAFTRTTGDFAVATISDEFCRTLDDVSATEVLKQISACGGFEGTDTADAFVVRGGARRLVEHLAAELHDAIVLGADVTRVEQTENDVRVVAGDRAWRAQHAIMTAPPQLLTRIALAPALPEPWVHALGRWRRGHVIKTLLVFETPWWRQSGLSGRILAPGARFSTVVDVTPPDVALGALVAFTVGDAAATPGPAEGAIKALLQHLARATRLTPPPLLDSVVTDWSAEPFSLGGYASRRAPGDWKTAPDLFAPIGRVHFAGTETATVWRSFMEGAVCSGEQAASAVLQTMQMSVVR